MAEAKSFRDELIEKVLLKMVQTHDAAASNVIKFYPNGRLGKCITLIVLSDENLDLDNWKVIEIPDKNDINPLECHMDLKIHNVIDYFEWNWIKDESKSCYRIQMSIPMDGIILSILMIVNAIDISWYISAKWTLVN